MDSVQKDAPREQSRVDPCHRCGSAKTGALGRAGDADETRGADCWRWTHAAVTDAVALVVVVVVAVVVVVVAAAAAAAAGNDAGKEDAVDADAGVEDAVARFGKNDSDAQAHSRYGVDR